MEYMIVDEKLRIYAVVLDFHKTNEWSYVPTFLYFISLWIYMNVAVFLNLYDIT